MLIQIVNVSVEDKGKYKQMKVAYRSNGKLSEKNVMSFGAGAPVFDVLSKAKQDESYDVVAAKNDKGFWDWTAATLYTGDTQLTPAKGNPSPAKSFETPEERASRQVLIVRQSSLSNAIEFLTLSKKTVTIENVLEVADTFVRYVFNKGDAPQPTVAGWIDLEDDIPL